MATSAARQSGESGIRPVVHMGLSLADDPACWGDSIEVSHMTLFALEARNVVPICVWNAKDQGVEAWPMPG